MQSILVKPTGQSCQRFTPRSTGWSGWERTLAYALDFSALVFSNYLNPAPNPGEHSFTLAFGGTHAMRVARFGLIPCCD